MQRPEDGVVTSVAANSVVQSDSAVDEVVVSFVQVDRRSDSEAAVFTKTLSLPSPPLMVFVAEIPAPARVMESSPAPPLASSAARTRVIVSLPARPSRGSRQSRGHSEFRYW